MPAAEATPSTPRIHETILDSIGNTPLVRLNAVTAGIAAAVVAKVEYMNPGGSVKDRIATAMIDQAERDGLLAPGGTIIEPTSGNTGVGLAIVAQQRGYHTIFVCPDKVSEDKIAVLRAYGAQVVVCPTAVTPDDPRSYYEVSDRLVRETPGGWKPDQYSNQMNPRAHYESTGPELWEQTAGKITHFVAGIGTGGTITGVGSYLKDVSGGRVQVVGVDPEGSVYSGGSGRPYLVEGVGEDFWPETYDKTVADRVIRISDAESFTMTRRLAREEGLLVGGSSGMAVAGALELARAADPAALIVVLLPDSGRGYLGKVFDDQWMASRGFIHTAEDHRTVGDILAAKPAGVPNLVHLHPHETIKAAIDLLAEYGVSQLPVLTAEPPVMPGEVVGAVAERELLDALFTRGAKLSDPIEPHMNNGLPLVGAREPLANAIAILREHDAALVLADGRPAGIVTRQDLLVGLTT